MEPGRAPLHDRRRNGARRLAGGRIARRHVPLDGEQARIGDRLQACRVARPERKPKQARPLRDGRERCGMRPGTLRLAQPGAHRPIGEAGPLDLAGELGAAEQARVAMRPAVRADLEQGIAQELLGTRGMREHPAAAGEERGLGALGPKVIDDAAVVAGGLTRRLAQIECERDQLLSGRQRHPADGTRGGPGRRRCRARLVGDAHGHRPMRAHREILARHGGQRGRPPAGGLQGGARVLGAGCRRDDERCGQGHDTANQGSNCHVSANRRSMPPGPEISYRLRPAAGRFAPRPGSAFAPRRSGSWLRLPRRP